MFLEGLVRILLWERDLPTLGTSDTTCEFLNEGLSRFVCIRAEDDPVCGLDQFPCIPNERVLTIISRVYLSVTDLLRCAVGATDGRDTRCCQCEDIHLAFADHQFLGSHW